MKKILVSLLPLTLLFVPRLVFAINGDSNPLNFTPPPTDISMVFLGNIFGVVDGVLAGTGSQILGQMFGVFNAAVLALGGIVLIYALLVGTLNTANEGEVLGKRWSSIWIPVRSAAGIALLIPKASGYCIMQIFVMWVVVQGVGAADKVWGAALGYLARGGTIVQTAAPDAISKSMVTAAGDMLTSTTCMYGLQYFLREQRKDNIANGTCTSGSSAWYCQAVPDFSQGINFTGATRASSGQVEVTFPNFDSTVNSNYASLFNGKCGSVKWTNVTKDEVSKIISSDTSSASDTFWFGTTGGTGINQLGSNQVEGIVQQAAQARAIATQQMYLNLSDVGRRIIENEFQSSNTLPLGHVAGSNQDLWQGQNNQAPLLSGTEIQNAVAAYNTLMNPTLRLLSGAISQSSVQFIPQAYKDGWIMAGSYYFNLVGTNNKIEQVTSKTTDVTTDASPATQVNSNFGNNKNLNGLVINKNYISQLQDLIGNSSKYNDPTSNKNCSSGSKLEQYICNATLLKQPGQPGLVPPQFAVVDNPSFDAIPQLQPQKIKGGWFDVPGTIMTFIYNYAIRYVLNLFIYVFNIALAAIMPAITQYFSLFVSVFASGLTQALANQTNPIMVLASTGNHFINIAVTLWTTAALVTVIAAANPVTLGAILALLVFLAPIVFLWLIVITVSGIIMAYYVPLVPYILFTYGALGWMIGVIEAMVAAPIVALGITHPEGHEAFGKADNAIMLLLNVFLRPAMMVIGLIAGIILSYVGIWLLNTGFSRAVGLGTGTVWGLSTNAPTPDIPTPGGVAGAVSGTGGSLAGSASAGQSISGGAIGGYSSGMIGQQTNFSALIGSVFIIVIYIIMYMQIVQKAFELINILPDKVLRWLSGGFQESLGAESGRMMQETGGSVRSGAQQTGKAVTKSIQSAKFGKGEKGKGGGEGKDGDGDGGDNEIQSGPDSGGGGEIQGY